MKRQLRNHFHATTATFEIRDDGTISAATYRRVRRTLCPSDTCWCGSSSASGPDMAFLDGAEPVYSHGHLVSWRLRDDR